MTLTTNLSHVDIELIIKTHTAKLFAVSEKNVLVRLEKKPWAAGIGFDIVAVVKVSQQG